MINYYNGEFLEEKLINIPMEASGFQYGYGIFTSLRTNNGEPILISAHLERLKDSCKVIGLSFPEVDYLKIIHELIKRNRDINLRLKIIIFEKSINQVGLLISATEFKAEYSPKTVTLISDNYEACNLRKIKSLNYMENVMLHRKALKTGFDKGLLINSDNLVCECCYANIFLVKNNKIYTPKANANILNGIIRQQLINSFPIIEKDIRREDLPNFDKVFTTNSVQGIVYIKQIDEFRYNSLPIAKLVEWEKSIGLK